MRARVPWGASTPFGALAERGAPRSRFPVAIEGPSLTKKWRTCPMIDRLKVMRLPQVMENTGLSKAEIYRRMGRGQFPQAVRLGPRAIGWRAGDVSDWLESLET